MQETQRPIELLYIRIFLAIFGSVIFISNILFWLHIPSLLASYPQEGGGQMMLVTVGKAFVFIFGPFTYGLDSIYLLLYSLNIPDQTSGVIGFILTGIISLSIFTSVLFGLSGRKRWGWVLTMSIITIYLVLTCIQVTNLKYSPILIPIAIFLVVLSALSRKNTRKYFLIGKE